MFVPTKSILLLELFSADKRKNPPVAAPTPKISFVDCNAVFGGIDKLFATEFEISFILGLSTPKSVVATVILTIPLISCCGVTPPWETNRIHPSHLKDAILTDDFASLYNKYADKVMGGTLTPDAIITRFRAKLWKDMKTWML